MREEGILITTVMQFLALHRKSSFSFSMGYPFCHSYQRQRLSV